MRQAPDASAFADDETVATLIMPLSSNGESVDMLFVTVDFLSCGQNACPASACALGVMI
ncbi:MAG: hypothetical protein RIM84_07505 [Alphaproteobacteria bacterium]